jgi:hypothetical protein
MKKIISVSLLLSSLSISNAAHADNQTVYVQFCKLANTTDTYCDRTVNLTAVLRKNIPVVSVNLLSFNGQEINKKQFCVAGICSFDLSFIVVQKIGAMNAKPIQLQYNSEQSSNSFITLVNVDAPPFAQNCIYNPS